MSASSSAVGKTDTRRVDPPLKTTPEFLRSPSRFALFGGSVIEHGEARRVPLPMPPDCPPTGCMRPAARARALPPVLIPTRGKIP